MDSSVYRSLPRIDAETENVGCRTLEGTSCGLPLDFESSGYIDAWETSMKSIRLLRETECRAEGLYDEVARLLEEAGEACTRSLTPVFVRVEPCDGYPPENVPVDVAAVRIRDSINVRLRPHGSEREFPLFQGTIDVSETKARGPYIRMRGSYIIPLALGRAQRSLQVRRRAEAALEAFLESLISEAERRLAA
jgi:hypothetical protein